MSEANDIIIWDGTTGAVSGSTPFGFYDTDSVFITDAPKVAKFCAQKLGYPIVDIELQDINFYTAFEQAITEYGYQINMSNIKDNLLSIMGASTGSDFTQQNITPTLTKLIDISAEYGSEAGSGGNVKWHTGSIDLQEGVQRYDLNTLYANITHPSESIEIKRVYHKSSPAITRYFDPLVGTGTGTQNFMNSMGMGGMTPGVSFMMLPLYDDLQRIQHIEFSDTIRKSGYSFRLIDNDLQIFPIPTGAGKMHFEYIVKSDRANPLRGSNTSGVSDASNAPYYNIMYSRINSVGRQWIYNFAAAISKEMLGQVRSKYSNIPIPNADTSLNGPELLSEAQQEKEGLIEKFREDLEKLSRTAQMEAAKEESEHAQEQLNKIPLGIYTG